MILRVTHFLFPKPYAVAYLFLISGQPYKSASDVLDHHQFLASIRLASLVCFTFSFPPSKYIPRDWTDTFASIFIIIIIKMPILRLDS